MEAAYYLFRSGRPARAAAAWEEQEEDIGSPSESESPSTSGDSSELDDDASSSCSSSTASDRRFEMSGLMTELPIKRGLSRFFDGRSQSFASLAAVGSLEDLAKPPRKRLKPSGSCGGCLDAHRGRRLLSPRRHCSKAVAVKVAAVRTGALAVLAAAAPRRPTLAAAPRPDGVAAGNVLVVS